MKNRLLVVLIGTFVGLSSSLVQGAQKWEWDRIKRGIPGAARSLEHLQYISKDELEARLPDFLKPARNGVDLYSLEYFSEDFEGQLQVLSGLVVVPDTEDSAFPLLSLQHGTIFHDSEAPTERLDYGLVEASQGFVTIVQDYMGYGVSRHLMHPYIMEKAYESSGINMIQAARLVARANQIDLSEHLFLKGYSEGGYATLSLQKAIERTGVFDITASAPQAGPYDVLAVGAALMSSQETNPALAGLFLVSYSHYYDEKLDLSVYFREPDVWNLSNLFDGSYNYQEISSVLPSESDLFFNPAYRSSFLDRYQKSRAGQAVSWKPIEERMIENSIQKGWTIASPTRFVHCVDDEVVTVGSSDEAFKHLGENNSLVSYERIESVPGQDPYRHGTCPGYYTPIAWFLSFL